MNKYMILLAVFLLWGVPYTASAYDTYSLTSTNTSESYRYVMLNESDQSTVLGFNVPKRGNVTSATLNISVPLLVPVNLTIDTLNDGDIEFENYYPGEIYFMNDFEDANINDWTPDGDNNFSLHAADNYYGDYVLKAFGNAGADGQADSKTFATLSNGFEFSVMFYYNLDDVVFNLLSTDEHTYTGIQLGKNNNDNLWFNDGTNVVNTGVLIYKRVWHGVKMECNGTACELFYNENMTGSYVSKSNYTINQLFDNVSMMRIETLNSDEGQAYFDNILIKEKDIPFNDTTEFDLNVTAINDYLHDKCSGAWGTATCSFPINISGNSSGADINITTLSLTVDYIYGRYNVSVIDEITGNGYNNDIMILTALCKNDTETTTLTSSTTNNIWIGCDINHLELEVNDSSGNTHWRTLRPESGYQQLLTYFMANQTTHTVIKQDWSVYDIAGEYANGSINIHKVVPNYGSVVVIDQLIDAESKVILHLINGETYTFIVYNEDKTQSRNIGGYLTDTDTAKILTLSQVPFYNELTLIQTNVYYTVDQNASGRYIRFYYNDTLSQTNSVNVYVYNASNITQLMYTSSDTNNFIIFTYNNVNINTSYICKFVISHARYGTIESTRTVDFGYASSTHIAGMSALGLEKYEALFAMMVIIFTVLLFGARSASFGLGVAVIETLMFYRFGWFKEIPAMGPGLLIILVILVVLAVLAERSRSG